MVVDKLNMKKIGNTKFSKISQQRKNVRLFFSKLKNAMFLDKMIVMFYFDLYYALS